MVDSFDIFRVLAQGRYNDTATHTIYTKPTPLSKIITITGIVVCNTTASAINYSIYICTNGTTYDQTTALLYQNPIAANETQVVDLQVSLDTASGTIGVQNSSANAINFTVIGKIREI